MAQDEKEDVRDTDDADAKEGASEEESSAEKAAESADKHEAERSAAKAHVEAKDRTEKAVGAPHAGEHPHAHKPNRKEYMVIFAVLFVLTILEVAVAQVPGIAKGLLTLALVSLAVTKAAFVGLFYMHLKHETKILKLTIAIPLSAPAVYAVVLIADAAWRLAR